MEALTAYEVARQQRIEENRARMALLGLTQTVQAIAQTGAAEKARVRQQRVAARKAAVSAAVAPGRVRRSNRLEGQDSVDYNENARLLLAADPEGGKRDRRLLRENSSEEVYGISHLDALGTHQQEWQLFVDGFDAEGNRVYDKVNGNTCHQCRQKTMGKRTCCSGCGSLRGTLCGDCLFMRYGENVDEATAKAEWTCPMCRDICNCSFHRSKRGWAPTGTLYRRAAAEGYTSVSHYLVYNNLDEEAKAEALRRGVLPPALAAEIEKELQASSASATTVAVTAAEQGEGAAPEAEAATVQEQLVELDPAEAAEAVQATQPQRAGRRGRAGAEPAATAPATQQQASGMVQPAARLARSSRQATLEVVALSNKRKAGAPKAPAGKAAKAGAEQLPESSRRRGLRTRA